MEIGGISREFVSEGLSGITINLCGGYYAVSKDVPRKRYVPDRRQVRLWFPVTLRALALLVSGVIASHNISLLNEL